MKRVPVRVLVPGQSLSEPLNGPDGKLLLAKRHVLTEEMTTSLLRTGIEYVYLGEWDEAEFKRYESSTPVSDHREAAEKMARALQAEIEKQLDAGSDLDAQPSGEALEGKVNGALQVDRSEEQIKQCEETCEESVEFVEQVLDGLIEDGRVAEAATAVIEKVIDVFTADRSLALNYVYHKGSPDYLHTHPSNVSLLAMNIATALQYGEDQVRDIGVTALLEDVGMAMVPKQVVYAARKLSRIQFIDIQKHPSLSLYVLKKYKNLPAITHRVTYQHHERLDGSGYPGRREKIGIHRYARILAVADSYAALISERPWRKALHPYNAMETVVREANQGRLETESVRGLLHCLSLYPVGSLVRLSSGEVAKVIHSNGASIDRPVVSVLFDSNGQAMATPRTVDLLQDENTHVASIVEEDLDVGLHDGF